MMRIRYENLPDGKLKSPPLKSLTVRDVVIAVLNLNNLTGHIENSFGEVIASIEGRTPHELKNLAKLALADFGVQFDPETRETEKNTIIVLEPSEVQ